MLTLMGYVLIVNTLIESLFVYRLNVIAKVDDSLVTILELHNFCGKVNTPK